MDSHFTTVRLNKFYEIVSRVLADTEVSKHLGALTIANVGGFKLPIFSMHGTYSTVPVEDIVLDLTAQLKAAGDDGLLLSQAYGLLTVLTEIPPDTTYKTVNAGNTELSVMHPTSVIVPRGIAKQFRRLICAANVAHPEVA